MGKMIFFVDSTHMVGLIRSVSFAWFGQFGSVDQFRSVSRAQLRTKFARCPGWKFDAFLLVYLSVGLAWFGGLSRSVD